MSKTRAQLFAGMVTFAIADRLKETEFVVACVDDDEQWPTVTFDRNGARFRITVEEIEP